ncbi:hypothetical protein DB347_20675 [Opitutaceae bacterium EW11]|nr:hypothetical protein DB347_20675 [Opitutaceae bacterium EW11]
MSSPQCPLGSECSRVSLAEADLNRLFNLSLDLLCLAGTDGYFKRVNPSWSRVLGWSEAELLARPVHEFMHPDDRERTLKAREALIAGEPVRGLENRYLCKDGTYRWLSWQSSFAPETGTVFAVARDVTERRRLDEERLVVSKLEATGIMAGGVAHDFNNLLAGMLLSLEMVNLLGLTSEQERYLRKATQAIDAAKALTWQLIMFADRGSAALEICDLAPLLHAAADEALQGTAVPLACEIATDLWRAEVDASQIGKVIHALLMNAREATPDSGSVKLRAENIVLDSGAAPERLSGKYVRITVSDTGTGIAPEILPKIFDPYFSTKRRGDQKGMGLGLTICRSILRRHGGSISVESRLGEGTTVVCHLPALRDERAGNPVPP